MLPQLQSHPHDSLLVLEMKECTMPGWVSPTFTALNGVRFLKLSRAIVNVDSSAAAFKSESGTRRTVILFSVAELRVLCPITLAAAVNNCANPD